MTTVIEARNLAKSFGRVRALDGLSFSVKEGEILALLGPTGAGKTTTMRCLAGLEKPDSGEIVLDGVDVTGESARARDVAVVFEGFNLLPTLSVRDNVAFPLRSPVYRESEDLIASRVSTAAADLKISHLLDRRIDQLSGGEKQRVAIARALVRRPRAFLLDEPLSALDLKLREALQAELKEVHEKFGATVLYASHDFPSTAELADRIALIEDGRILQIGRLPELIADPHWLSVGLLIGSPSLAQFSAGAAGGEVTIDDTNCVFSAASLDLSPSVSGAVRIGIWPEDVVLLSEARSGTLSGIVWATDFRGADQAIEVRVGSHRLRKAVPRDILLREGETVHLFLPPESCFTFAPETGRRLDTRTKRSADAQSAEAH